MSVSLTATCFFFIYIYISTTFLFEPARKNNGFERGSDRAPDRRPVVRLHSPYRAVRADRLPEGTAWYKRRLYDVV